MHLVASGQQRHLKRPIDFQRRVAGRGGQRQFRRAEKASGRQHYFATAHILAGQATVGATLDAWTNDDALAFQPAIFLHHHRVGCTILSFGHDGAGQHAHGGPARLRAWERMSGGGATNDWQHRVQGR